MDVNRRGQRRHQQERMKARAARVNYRWHGSRVTVKSSGSAGTVYYTAQELRRNIGRLAAMHCTHQCGMCKREKILGKMTLTEKRAIMNAREMESEVWI